MILDDLSLDPEWLWLVVFGPGYGESIVVAVPGGHWMVVDSLQRDGEQGAFVPALRLLENHDAELSLAALTHPHRDHAGGFARLLDRRRLDTPVGCVDAYLSDEPGWRPSSDASRVKRQGAVDRALNRIDHIWKREPGSRWPLLAGSTRVLGDAQVEVIHPAKLPRNRPRDPNRLSTPMRISWHGCELLLGADLPRSGWNAVAREFAEAGRLAEASLLKASHHGSTGAQHRVVTGDPPPGERPCVVTPFNSRAKLPDYSDGQGIDRLLKTHSRVCVTSVPSGARGRAVKRASLMSQQVGFGELTLVREDEPAAPTRGWVAMGFNEEGVLEASHAGDAAGVVV